MKKYWLVLHQDTFLWTKGNDGLIYSTSEKHLCFRFQNVGILKRITEELSYISNLYRTSITEEELDDKEVKMWIEQILSSSSGKLIDMEDKNETPVSLKPVLKVQDTVTFYQSAHKNHTDGNIMQNLLKLVIHLNGSECGDDNISKQIIFPRKGSQEQQDWTVLRDFITSMGKPNFLVEIALVGNVWKYPGYRELLDYLQTLPIRISIYCTEEDYANYGSDLCLSEKVSYHVLKKDYGKPIAVNKGCHYHFIVSSEEEYEMACQLIEAHSLENYRVLPLYTGTNDAFFEDLVYLSEEDIQDFHLSKREIFARQAINENLFGTLTVDLDGQVYGNLNEPSLGTMEDGLYMLTYKEMTEGHSWLQIRDSKPCSNCIYQWLCPSPSNYEKVIGKSNLCHVKP